MCKNGTWLAPAVVPVIPYWVKIHPIPGYLLHSFDLLKQVIENEHVPILRTITRGVPHWIIVKGFNFVYPDKYTILDPWLGEIEYTEKELDDIWKPRQYQFFELTNQSFLTRDFKQFYKSKDDD